MKRFPFFLFVCLLQTLFSKNLMAVEAEETRRMVNYPSPAAYIDSFSEGNKNTGKDKVLFIGAGLAYDDLVKDTQTHFLTDVEIQQTREKYYPLNAYLVDLDGKLFEDYAKGKPSLSDLQADITKEIGGDNSLPEVFKRTFDFIILESITFEALTGKSFKNLYSLLKDGGSIINNAFFQTVLKKDVSEIREERFEFATLDPYDNAILELYYPSDWVDEEESLIEQYEYVMHPIDNQDDEAYKKLSQEYQQKEIKIINFSDFSNLYKNDEEYKRFIFSEVKEIYQKNITDYLKKLIPDANVQFPEHEELWCAKQREFGFFKVTKPGNG